MKKQTPLLKAIRDIAACAVFIMFILLFMNWGGVFDKILGWLPKFEFWPAVMAVNVGILVLILAVTMVFGRWYCSILCPLGVLQDGIYRLRILGPAKRRFRQKWSPARNWMRYIILVLYLAALALGFGSIAYFIEPYSSFGTMMATAKGIEPVQSVIVASATLAVIVLLVWKGGRTWCNTVCPVGAALSLFSARSLFRPVIDESKCVSCGLCGKACRASCIDTANHSVDMSRCVLCFDCLENCNEGAIEYKFSLPKVGTGKTAEGRPADKAEGKPADKGEKSSNSRRAFLTASALAVGAMALKAEEGHGGLAPIKEKKEAQRQTPIVPSGALSLDGFNKHCIGCQLCVSVCPNKVLRPSVSFDSFMKPYMSYEAGFCRPECTACSDVCPAGAIKKVSVEEKSSISIGHAVYNPEICVVRTDGVHCGNCARHCPTGAITMVRNSDGLGIPAVDSAKCIGCGHCEYVCPSRPVSAIHVEGNEVHHRI